MGIPALIVEDDDFLAQMLSKVLTDAGYDATVVNDGHAATQSLSLHPAQFVVSDIRMPKLDGIQLLHWCKKNAPDSKVILMTGFSNIMETHEAAEIGAHGFLVKPFKREELLALLDQLGAPPGKCRPAPDTPRTSASPEAPHDSTNVFSEGEGKTGQPGSSPRAAQTDSDFCRLSLEDFVSGKRIPYSVWIRISECRYVKIAHANEEIDLPRIKAYKEKNVVHLYLTKEDFVRYLQQSLTISANLTKSAQISKPKQLHFLKHAGDVLQTHVLIEGVNPESYRAAKNYVKAAMEVVGSRTDLMTLLELLNQHAEFLFAHSLGVALYSVMICQQLGWNSAPTTHTVMLCGLFHDIGMKEIDAGLLGTPRIMLNQQQRSIIESHCARGSDMMSSVQEIPHEIAQVTLQHHENCIGTGYPNFLKKLQISSLSRLIAVADCFCEYAIRNPDHPKGMHAKDAFQQMSQFKKSGLDAQFLAAFEKALFG
ncbi:MAG: response regulator [Bdellovibrionales bacterium]|nr:response regulator [Bdellovibrionales bacterium]